MKFDIVSGSKTPGRSGKIKLVAVDNKGEIARIPEDVADYFLKRANGKSSPPN